MAERDHHYPAYAGDARWRNWIARLEWYFEDNDIAEKKNIGTAAVPNLVDNPKRLSTLMKLVPADTYDIIVDTVRPRNVQDMTYTEIKDMMQDKFEPVRNKRTARYDFDKRERKVGESVEQYIAELKRLEKDCDFGRDRDNRMCDRLISGIKVNRIVNELVGWRDDQLTFEAAAGRAIQLEKLHKDVQTLGGGEEIKKIQSNGYRGRGNNRGNYRGRNNRHQGERHKGNNYQYKNTQNKTSKSKDFCWRCEGNHKQEECFHKDKTCYYCKKVGHIPRACITKKKDEGTWRGSRGQSRGHNPRGGRQGRRTHQVEVQSDDEETAVMNYLNINKVENDAIILNLELEGKPIDMELDTGASTTIIPAVFYHNYLKHLELSTAPILTTYTKEKIPTLGVVNVQVRHTDKDRGEMFTCSCSRRK